MAIRFPGGGTSYLDYTGGAVDTANATVLGWVYVSTDTNDYVSCLPRFRNSGDSTTMWLGTVASGTNVSVASATGGEVSTGKDLIVGKWMPIAFSSTGGAVTVYAADSASTAVTTATGTLSGNTPAAKYSFGARGNGDATENFNGRLAGWKLYNGTLSLAEIRTEWSQLYPVRTQGLYAAYPMDANNAEGRLDVSGNGRMLTLVGTALATEDGPPIIRQRIAVRPYRFLYSAGVARDMDGSGSAAAGFTGDLGRDRGITSHGDASSSATGSLSGDRPVAGNSSGAAGFTGDFVRDLGVAGSSSAAAGLTGDASTARAIDGAATGSSGASADMVLSLDLGASAGGSSGATGSLSLTRDVAGSSSSSSGASGDLSLARALAAAVVAASVLSGELGGAGVISGKAVAAASFTGDAVVDRAILGIIAGASGLTGNLTVTNNSFAGSSAAAAFAAAVMTAARDLNGKSGSSASARGSLTVTSPPGADFPAIHVLLPVITAHISVRRPTVTSHPGVRRPTVNRK